LGAVIAWNDGEEVIRHTSRGTRGNI